MVDDDSMGPGLQLAGARFLLGHRLPMTSRLELRCVRPSVRTSTKRFFRFPSNLVCG